MLNTITDVGTKVADSNAVDSQKLIDDVKDLNAKMSDFQHKFDVIILAGSEETRQAATDMAKQYVDLAGRIQGALVRTVQGAVVTAAEVDQDRALTNDVVVREKFVKSARKDLDVYD